MMIGTLTLLGLTMTGPIDDADLLIDRVAPILESRCLHCHSGDRPKGSLSLETRDGLRVGGFSGPAIDSEDPEFSLLLDVVSGGEPQMPPEGDPLNAEQVEAIRQWLDAGAPWPEGVTLRDRRFEGAWWSLVPLRRPEIPEVSPTSTVRNPIDAFILDRLKAEGLTPAPEADRRTLIRRATYDLTGLPPTPEAVDAFLADESPDAFERVIDRLLASPRYGERRARRWLDLVHYADTHGYDKDKRRPHAWRYRDYVIESLNEDTPYARFIEEQIAGDVLFPGEPERLIATGFIAAGPWDFVGHVELREGTVDKEKTRLIDRDDMLANTMSTFVSLTVHCARCHDHKFDPIPQVDYYRLQAVFAGVERGDRPIDDAGSLVYAALPREPRPIRLLNRGDVESPGEEVSPGALSCVSTLNPEIEATSDEGARRAALARWITDPENPLTWRSFVNRAWQDAFGRGIVDTPSDFGRNGSMPTHPELLDWLAVEFRDSGGSIKALDRLIMTSNTYRQASTHHETNARIDAGNRFVWRQERRRLEAEEIRDATLFASGVLDDTMGGPGFDLFRFKDDHSPIYDHDDPEWIDPVDGRRRAVYRFVVRSVPNPFIECLDGADPNINVPVRNETITALQALALLNDPFMIARSEDLASRVQAVADDLGAQIDSAYRLTVARSPTPDERLVMVSYAREHGLAAACRILFNLNEFVFLD
ncbi:PSD1 and planctomycete cytochrome C domain-containing protein [Tautonia marina]|uniref:PSD1 and planctomycete cytochrome C domain-containing protein n=1 Tax=Tautonia marina TaxID=2653855 RepID=UPI001260ED05|nr:PSD1 and planctomycete cytochrome C domain-containing protein [Tautonia marina]